MDKQNGSAKEREKELQAKTKKRKGSRKKGSSDRIIPIVEKVIAVLLALALVYGIGHVIVSQSGLIEKTFAVAKVGNVRIPMTIYNYAYRNTYNELFDTYAKYYSYIGASVGFDIEKAPSDQPYTASAEEIEKYPESADWETWADVIEYQTLENLRKTYARYLTALETEGSVEESTLWEIPVTTEAVTSEETDGTSEVETEVETSLQMLQLPYKALSEEELAELDTQIESLRQQNAEYSLSLNAYLANRYGRGFTESVLRKNAALEMLSSRLILGKTQEFKAKYEDKEITKIYKENLDKYAVLDYLIFTIDASVPEQKEGEKDDDFAKRLAKAVEKNKKKAQIVFNGITGEESYLAEAKAQGKKQAEDPDEYEFNEDDLVNMRTNSNALNEIRETAHEHDDEGDDDDHYSDAVKWAFNSKRKRGDFAMFFDENGTASVIYIMNPAYSVTPVTVREIVISPTSFSDDSTFTDEEIEAAKNKIDDLVKVWNDGKKTPERFAELAKTNSTAESAADGGLQEINSSSTQSELYLDWALSSNSKVGDIFALNIDDDYYLLYLEKKGKPEYFETIANEKSSEEYAAFEDAMLEKDEFKLNTKSLAARWATKQNEKFIRKYGLQSKLNEFAESQSGSSGLEGLF